jgi:hypothetical protein
MIRNKEKNMKKTFAILAIAGTMMTASIPAKADFEWLGPVLGGVAGGFIGNQFGGGKGKTALTAGGAVAGVLLGQEAVRKPAQTNVPVITQGNTNGTVFVGGPCDRYMNQGAKAACNRGVSERAAQAQRQIEQEAYRNARGNSGGNWGARYARW